MLKIDYDYIEISQETARDMYATTGRYSKTEDPLSDIHMENHVLALSQYTTYRK